MKYNRILLATTLSFALSFSSMATLFNSTAHAASKSFNFSESTSQTQTHTITLPNLKSINSITSNTGSVSVQSINGNEATIKLSGGSPTRNVLTGGSPADSKTVTNQTSPTYNVGGYTGTLSSYLYSGSYTPPQNNVFMEAVYKGYPAGQTMSDVYSVQNNVMYSNWIFSYSVTDTAMLKPGTGDMRPHSYGNYYWDGSLYRLDIYMNGYVNLSAIDTRVYRYQGTVSKPDTRTYQNYYQYNVTVDYVDNTAPVMMTANTTITRSAETGHNIVTIQGTISDVDNDNVTISANLNGKSKNTTVSNTSTTKTWALIWDVANDNLAQGNYSNITITANDGKGGASTNTYTGNIIIDRTKPVISFTPDKKEGDFKDIEVQTILTDSGGSGLKQFRYAWTKDDTYPTNDWSDWAALKDPTLKQEKSGKWYLHIEAEDYVGNLAYVYSGTYEKITLSGGPSVTINVFPTPTGIWYDKLIDVYVMESGDTELLSKAIKTYEITNSSLYPSAFTKTIPNDKKIQLNLMGENFIHVQYVLDDGTKISSTTGPYLIDTGMVGDFDMELIDAGGKEATDWSKDNLKLVLTNPSTSSVSDLIKQYRMEGVHTDWQPYTEGMTINAEGEHRIFGRIINKAGSSSLQKAVVAKIDRTNPNISSLKLSKNANGSYEVQVKTDDNLSGIKSIQLNNGTNLTIKNGSYIASGLLTKPTHITVQDEAGNQLSNIAFASEPTINFETPYTPSLERYTEDVVANLSGATGYLIGNRAFACSTNPCQVTLSANTTLTAVHTAGANETRTSVKIENIDKTNIQLLLSGKRNISNPLKVEFKWNPTLSSGTLSCTEDGQTINYTVSGANHEMNGKNYMYTCTLTGIYKGQTFASNTIAIYSDGKLPAEGSTDVPMKAVKTNVYIMETKLGKSYIINAKSDNYKYNELPIPQNEITKD